MFRKLLSNLPFNPSLINQVSFYAKRVHQEEGVRRSGMVLMVLALLLQLFAVVSPPQASLQASSNDIIPGGFTKQSTAVEYCTRNAYNFKNILAHPYIKVTCEDLAKATTRTIRSTEYERKLLSLGRIPYGKKGERAIYVEGDQNPLYFRYLWSWDTGAYSSYKALVGTTSEGAAFMVLYDCGNITIVESSPTAPPPPTTPSTPTPVPATTPKPKPNIEIVDKTTLAGTPKAGTKVRPGDVLGYRIYFRNTGKAAATNVFVEDSIPNHTTFVTGSMDSHKAADRDEYKASPWPGHPNNDKHVYWVYNSLPAGATGYYVDFKVRVDFDAKNDTSICNQAFIRSNESDQTNSNRVCHTVTNQINFTPDITIPSTPPPPTVTTPTPTPVVTKPCAASQTSTDTDSCWELHKTARNDTKGADANNTTAAAGDTITYTLTAKNNANIAATTSAMVNQENLADVMEYADTPSNLSGGTMDSAKIVRWAAATVQPGQTVTKTITIKIKSAIPNTTPPPGNPGSFDLMMTNVYGDAVNIKLPGSVATIVARANTTLPNTGPGEVVTVAVLLTFMAAYFFSRSRLMGKELDLVREEFAASGGY